MNHFNQQKTAFTFGVVLAGWHLMWSLIVALGVGQLIYDFVLWAHMIHLPIIIGPFDLQAAAVLIVMTFGVGYMMGWTFAYVWNRLHRN